MNDLTLRNIKLYNENKELETHLKKVIKENSLMLNYKECEHDWEPDTSMTVMRCDKCDIGLNTHSAMEYLTSNTKTT